VVNAGGIFDLSDRSHLLFSAGHTIQGKSQFQTYLGVQMTFGPEKAGK
jgi:hypothetical protein